MANVLLGYPNIAPDSTLSGGSWQTDLNNLKDKRTRIVARSMDATSVNTQFDIDNNSSKPIQIIALKRHNISVNGKIRITSYEDNSYTTPVYDSGFVDVYGSIFNSIDLEWEDDNYWLGTISQDDISLFTSIWFVVLPALYSQRYWRIEIDDTGNPDNYVEIGYLFMSNSWSPECNFQYGGALNDENRTASRDSLSGVSYYDVREQRRSFTFTLGNMEYTEGYQRAFDITRELGIHKDIFVSIDHEDTLNRFRNTLIGTFVDVNPIVYSRYARMSKQFAIREDS